MSMDKEKELPDQDLTYEKAIKRLEEIVSLLERGDLPLDQAMEAFREGVSLSAFCTDKLNSMKEEILQLAGADGSSQPLE